jgi:biotin carboxyl carrier protein
MYKAKIEGRTFLINGTQNDLKIDGFNDMADILEYNPGKFHVILNKQTFSAEILSLNKETKTCEIKVGRSIMTVELSDRYDELLHEMGIGQMAGAKVNDIKAPMPGMVLQVMVQKGQPIKKGDALFVLEAMKMENILKSPADGIINKIHVNKGDKVEKNQVMVNLD